MAMALRQAAGPATRTATRLSAHRRDQRHADGRRDACAADHLHGRGAADGAGRAARPAAARRRPSSPRCASPWSSRWPPTARSTSATSRWSATIWSTALMALRSQRRRQRRLCARRPQDPLWRRDGGAGTRRRDRLPARLASVATLARAAPSPGAAPAPSPAPAATP